MKRLDEIKDYNYYFQFTLTSYGADLETNVPNKSSELIDTFISLSKKIGKEKVIWRYDPIILTDKYDIDYHVKYFDKLAELLHEYTEKCVISFLDLYKKTEKNLKGIQFHEITNEKMEIIAELFSKICKKYGLRLATCCEEINLQEYGIEHNKCIDDELIKRISGRDVLNSKRDAQRKACGCIKCVDIGAYNTCLHHCRYCYASYNEEQIRDNIRDHDENSTLLIGKLNKDVKLYFK